MEKSGRDLKGGKGCKTQREPM